MLTYRGILIGMRNIYILYRYCRVQCKLNSTVFLPSLTRQNIEEAPIEVIEAMQLMPAIDGLDSPYLTLRFHLFDAVWSSAVVP